MNDRVGEVLAQLIRRHGTALVDDPRRLEGMLRDTGGENRREIFVIINAVKAHVAEDLLALPSGMPAEYIIAKLEKRLVDDLGLADDVAAWTVNVWAEALLGVKINSQAPPSAEINMAGHMMDTPASESKPRIDECQSSIRYENESKDRSDDRTENIYNATYDAQSSEEPIYKMNIGGIVFRVLWSFFSICGVVGYYRDGFDDAMTAFAITAAGIIMALAPWVDLLNKWRKRVKCF